MSEMKEFLLLIVSSSFRNECKNRKKKWMWVETKILRQAIGKFTCIIWIKNGLRINETVQFFDIFMVEFFDNVYHLPYIRSWANIYVDIYIIYMQCIVRFLVITITKFRSVCLQVFFSSFPRTWYWTVSAI